MFCDLHTHSTFSDGKDTPEQIVLKALDLGLEAVALCDHDCVDGLPRFLKAARGKNIRAVAGAEFSVDYKDKELHLLALFIPEESFSVLTDLMEKEVRRKEKRNRDLIEKLNAAGYDLSYEEIRSSVPCGKFNRVAIAEAMMKKGYVESVKEAFATVLSEKGEYYEPGKRIDFFEMLEIIRSVKAVPVLAHPFLQLNKEELEEFLPVAKKAGLAGMECMYSDFSVEQTECALELAEKFGLERSGGSDYHGSNKPHINLGVGRGNLRIPDEWVARLESAAVC